MSIQSKKNVPSVSKPRKNEWGEERGEVEVSSKESWRAHAGPKKGIVPSLVREVRVERSIAKIGGGGMRRRRTSKTPFKKKGNQKPILNGRET